jgi:hypothetical protein
MTGRQEGGSRSVIELNGKLMRLKAFVDICALAGIGVLNLGKYNYVSASVCW